jgi:hypothetical protein
MKKKTPIFLCTAGGQKSFPFLNISQNISYKTTFFKLEEKVRTNLL